MQVVGGDELPVDTEPAPGSLPMTGSQAPGQISAHCVTSRVSYCYGIVLENSSESFFFVLPHAWCPRRPFVNSRSL